MKRIITKDNSANRRLTTAIIIAAFIIAVSLVFAVVYNLSHQDEGSGAFHPGLPTISFNDGNGYSQRGETGGILLKATTGFSFVSGTKVQEIDIPNDRANDCAFTLSIYLADGTEVFCSDYLYPGESLRRIQLSKELDPGIYKNALLIYQCYTISEPHCAISQCEFRVEINSY